MDTDYRTVQGPGRDELVIKKSRFIGQACPADTEAQALAYIKQVREQNREANHTCYAYIIGKNEGIMRYSDDGEPGGTAGMPILSVIRAQKVVDCCVTVTRYFGGILLGASGLVRAYTKATASALSAARVIHMEASIRFWVGMDYSMWERVNHYLADARLSVMPILNEGVEFGATVTATLVSRARDYAAACANVARITDGRCEMLELERFYHGWAESPSE